MDGPIARGAGAPRPETPAGLVDALLDTAGLRGPWAVEQVSRIGWINTNTVVRIVGGERVVVREYGWPFDEPQRYDRAAKEAWLHPVLSAAGVAVPEVMATAEHEGRQGVLLGWLPGEALGVVAQRVPADELAQAWAQSGEALARAHSIHLPHRSDDRAVPGFLSSGGQVEPFPGGTVGGFHLARIAQDAPRAAGAHRGLGLDPARIVAAAEAAVPLLDAAEPTLCHSDSHAWNVLVAQDGLGRWALSGWLDWEFAWVGDPAWDHMRMLEQRFAPIGPTPDAWWEGYGRRPGEVALAVSTLRFMLWKAVDIDDTRDRQVALAWLADAALHLERLESLLDGANGDRLA